MRGNFPWESTIAGFDSTQNLADAGCSDFSCVMCVQVKKNDYPQLEFLLNTEVAEEEFKRADKNSKSVNAYTV
jgi:hypothetical protein